MSVLPLKISRKIPSDCLSGSHHQLTRRDRAFSEITFVGGSKTGAKETGRKLRINLSAVRAAAALLIRHSHTLRETLADRPDAVVYISDNYWKAIAKTFPEAWNDKKNFILLQSIGLNGFAEFGGAVIDRAGENVEVDDFAEVLEGIKSKRSLERTEYVGIAGAGGGNDEVARRLREAYTTESVMKAKILRAVGEDGQAPEARIEEVTNEASASVDTPDSPDEQTADAETVESDDRAAS